MTWLRAIALLSTCLALGLPACAGNETVTGGERDSGSNNDDDGNGDKDEDRGEIGERCNSDEPKCNDARRGAECLNGTCCATLDGARCRRDSECCGSNVDCDGNTCCGLAGKRCSDDNECCGDLQCNENGTCGQAECDFKDCDECTNNGCGWCGDTGSCQGGSRRGPDTEQGCDDWRWGSDANCSGTAGCDADSCSECITNSGCGWCGGDTACMEGDADAPLGGNTCSGDWSWTGTECSQLDDQCEANSCTECNQMDGCGWCASLGECQPDQGPCTDWKDTEAQCGADCDGSSCGDCISGSCGWCDADNTCMVGDSGGSEDDSCTGSDWVWSSDECSSSGTTDCSQASTCGDCTSMSDCGWCDGDASCHAGTSSGPTDGSSCTSSLWRWSQSDCCESRSSCSQCLDEFPCGWCDGDSTCTAGDSGGPDVGSCSSSDWKWVSCDSGGSCLEVKDSSCSVDDDCCDTSSYDMSCREGVSFGERCCKEAGSDCGGSSECCGWMTCFGGQCECQEATEDCLDDRDCCSGLRCSDGECCGGENQACSGDPDCCPGLICSDFTNECVDGVST